MFGAFGGLGRAGGTFEASYRCYPASFIDKADLENGDKIILPPSALDRLSSLHIEFPMLFEISNLREGRHSHCGVLEFVAEEGVVYLPYWMMQNLLLSEGDIVKLKSTSLPKGTFVKLRPQSKDFLDITNPKAVLETTLRRYSCLTTGDSILITYNNKRYYIDIFETRPQRAVTIIETDCEVDFAPPLDYVEPVPQPKPAPPPAVIPPGVRVIPKAQPAPQASEGESSEPKFTAFGGVAKRLDGKAVAAPTPVPTGTSAPTAAAPVLKAASAGKLVFGQAEAPKAAPKAQPTPSGKLEEAPKPSFQPFQGTGNKLK